MHTWVYLLFALLFCAKGYPFRMETQQKSKVLFRSIIRLDSGISWFYQRLKFLSPVLGYPQGAQLLS